ncbi:MAG: TIGR02391 family protein [Leptolyngbyaceae cyanobacterium]
MQTELPRFEKITRRARQFTDAREVATAFQHPFDERNLSSALPSIVKHLFDDGHCAQATFEAYKFVDKEIQRHAKSSKSGFKLMMDALGGTNPAIRLNPMLTGSQQDEQKGFQFLFAGSILAIRNPRGHEHSLMDDPDDCLDHLSLASLLLRRLAEAGYT